MEERMIAADEIRKLHDSGLEQRDIAQILKVSQSTVWRKMRKFGIASRKKGPISPLRGPRNPMWAGADVKYIGAHERVYARRGKPKFCDKCGLDDPARRYEWANLTGDLTDVEAYMRMCVPCHRRHDIEQRKQAVDPNWKGTDGNEC